MTSPYPLSDVELAVLDQPDPDEAGGADDDLAEPELELAPAVQHAHRFAYLVCAIDSALMAIDREQLDVDAPSLDQLLAVRGRAVRR